VRLFDTIAYEKANMTPIRFVVNWIVAPIFVVFSIACLTTASILMEIDDVKYLPAFIVLMVLFVVVIAALLVSVPFVRRREIDLECAVHDYDTTDVEDRDRYAFGFEDGSSVSLEPAGVVLFDRFFHYSNFHIAVETSSLLNRVIVRIGFTMKHGLSMAEGEDGATNGFHLELTKELVHAVDRFEIPLANREVLDALLADKRRAFEQIYLTGRVKVESLR
jgi:hypothetical protein